MPKYKKVKGHFTRSPAQQRALLRTAGARGRRIIGGKQFFLMMTTDTKSSARQYANLHRKAYHVRVIPSKQYGGYELWVRKR